MSITKLEWLTALLIAGEDQTIRWLCIYHPLLPTMSDETDFACKCKKIYLPSIKIPYFVNGFGCKLQNYTKHIDRFGDRGRVLLNERV